MTWNPNYQEEFRRRLINRNKLIQNPELQQKINKFYSSHPVEWINDWCVTFDPRAEKPKPRLMPFLLFPRQVDFVHYILGCLQDKESGLIEKSRDMGATWLCCAISAWLWLYRPGTVIGWGSRKESYVDKMGDPKAIFPKIRQILENLPPWMLPEGYKASVHAVYMRIVNPVNLCAIIGEAGESMGRGGRTSIYFKDESAHYEHPEMIEAALGDNTDVQIDMSSVNGTANVFYRRRQAGEVWHPDTPSTPGKTRVFIFDWRDNPLKNEQWYESRRKKAESEGLLHIFAQEVDRDYSGSVERVIIKAEWVKAAIDAHIKLNFSDDGMRVAGQDVADGGGDKNALAIAYGVVLRHVEHWGGEAGDAARAAIPSCIEHRVSEIYYDSIGVGAGFKTEINNMKERGNFPASIRVFPWNGGGEVLEPDEHIIRGDSQSPTNYDQYANLKAQGWWRLRARFYKTYRAIVHGDVYAPEELISLDSRMPHLHQLCMELTQAIHKYNTKGKTLVDKKPAGSLSPNLADAVVIAFNPTREVTIFDVL